MRILFVTAELGYRGTPRALANYVQMLSPAHEVAVWGYCEGGDTADRLSDSGYVVYCGAKDAVRAYSFKPDIVNIHRPGFYISRETEILSEFKNRGAKCIETNVFGRVDWSVESILDVSLQISKWDLYRWNAWKGQYRVPGVYVPNPVDTERFKRANQEAINDLRARWLGSVGKARSDDAFILGRIGKTNWKFLERVLIEALDAFPEMIFVHVGDYGDSSLPNSIRRHPRVCIHPKMLTSEELSQFYSACNAMVSMSGNGESFGYVNAEAMACETPVIALATPYRDNAQLEMVSGYGGVVIHTPGQLIAAIKNIWRGNFRGDLCRRSIVDRYSFSTVSAMLNQVISCCMSSCVNDAIVARSKDGSLTVQVDAKSVFQMLKSMGFSVGSLFLLRLFHSRVGCCLLNCFKKAKKALKFGV